MCHKNVGFDWRSPRQQTIQFFRLRISITIFHFFNVFLKPIILFSSQIHSTFQCFFFVALDFQQTNIPFYFIWSAATTKRMEPGKNRNTTTIHKNIFMYDQYERVNYIFGIWIRIKHKKKPQYICTRNEWMFTKQEKKTRTHKQKLRVMWNRFICGNNLMWKINIFNSNVFVYMKLDEKWIRVLKYECRQS